MLRQIKGALRSYVFAADGAEFVARFNFFNNIYWHLPFTMTWNAANSSYQARHGSESVAFARKERLWVYARGIDERFKALSRMYLLPQVPLAAGDVVLDCGANIGEFSRCVSRRQAQAIAIEPEESEARCIASNVPSARAVITSALWKESGFIEFYSKNDTADSSVFEVAGYQNKVRVPTITLDEIFDKYQLDRVKLLKLEAEGAEPEVLQGARECLRRIDYITADLGPERGVRKETTLAPVANYLHAAGFELVDVYARRLICLFRNTRGG